MYLLKCSPSEISLELLSCVVVKVEILEFLHCQLTMLIGLLVMFIVSDVCLPVQCFCLSCISTLEDAMDRSRWMKQIRDD